MGLSRVKLPKLSVPTFEGKVLNCKRFWEQFNATIHCKTRLNDTEELMYLQEALKDGLARFVIEGLTQTSESYEEGIKCLKEHYDRPRLAHAEHIRSIVDVAGRGSCTEQQWQGASPSLWCCNTVLLSAYKAARTDPLETLLTVILQQKLDENT